MGIDTLNHKNSRVSKPFSEKVQTFCIENIFFLDIESVSG
jgi:hypothetical protein